mmetsp:Transcript_8576/g.10358  ORF Transcript_8576/g.10358 Transcript_8576/m.10358 type:complete len:119 (-) Transcript_8576:155-511(-)
MFVISDRDRNHISTNIHCHVNSFCYTNQRTKRRADLKGYQTDIAAFGENIYAGTNGLGDDAYVSGTSFSAPIVSGAVAILLSLGVDPLMVKRLLLAGADHFETPGRPIRHDGGALNMY